MLQRSSNFISAFFACSYSTGLFFKSIAVKISYFSALVIFAFLNNLNARNSGANFIFYRSILLYFKSNTLVKF